ARRVVEADQFTRAGRWKTWSPMLLLGQDIHHATLGIVGLGRIGAEVAKRGRGFDMRLLYASRSRRPELERELGLEHVPLESLLEMENVVVLPHIGSATTATRGKMARIAAENLLAALEGRRPPNLVNPEAWRG